MNASLPRCGGDAFTRSDGAGSRAASVATVALLALLCFGPSCKREPAPPEARAADAADHPAVAPRGGPLVEDSAPAGEGRSDRDEPSEDDVDPGQDAQRDLRAIELPESAPDDAPLPAPGEVPDFLAPPGQQARIDESMGRAPAAALDLTVQLRDESASSSGQPRETLPDESLDSLMRHVRLEEEGADDEGSFASVTSTDSRRSATNGSLDSHLLRVDAPAGDVAHDRLRAPAWDVDGAVEDEPAPGWDVDLAIDEDPAPPPDACAHLQEEIDSRMAFLRRVASERDSFAWVESDQDATALRLLAAMRRCAEFPDDEDCRPPPMEVELRDVEPPRHQFERWPTDLEAEHKDPDEVPNDPKIRDLLHQLESCRRRQTPQPLLDRQGRH